MYRVIGPYVYKGGLLTTSEPSQTISAYLAMEHPVYLKLVCDAPLGTLYLDLRKIATFERGLPAFLTMDGSAFITAWFVSSQNQQGLANRYSDPYVRDLDDAATVGYIHGFNPVMDQALNIQPVSINAPDQASAHYRSERKSDLVIYGDRDLSNTLVFVNGVFHNTIYWNKAQYVIDGTYSLRQNQKYDIMCYDTTPVGGHTVVPITPSMCQWDTETAGIILTLPAGQSFAGKTAFIVIDGYLYYPGEILDIVSATGAYLHTAKIPFIQQWRHNPLTKKKPDIAGQNWTWDTPSFPDMTTPPVQTGSYRSINQQPDLDLFVNTRFVPIEKVTSPDFKMTRVTSPHSAIILINKAELSHQTVSPIPMQIINRYGVLRKDVPRGISRYGWGISPSYVAMQSGSNSSMLFVEQQDMDMDREYGVNNPGCVAALYPELEQSLNLAFDIHVFF